MTTLSKRIKELRMEKGLSQPQLARAIGCSKGQISFWENGLNEPKASYVVKLADVFGVSTDYLLGRTDW